jgi:hypothetical protein
MVHWLIDEFTEQVNRQIAAAQTVDILLAGTDRLYIDIGFLGDVLGGLASHAVHLDRRFTVWLGTTCDQFITVDDLYSALLCRPLAGSPGPAYS